MHSANNKHDVIREEMQIYEFEKEREITLLKKDYEKRIAKLEARLSAIEDEYQNYRYDVERELSVTELVAKRHNEYIELLKRELGKLL